MSEIVLYDLADAIDVYKILTNHSYRATLTDISPPFDETTLQPEVFKIAYEKNDHPD